MTTVVFDIEKFAVHDGPGIRTVVFLKGCPLRCAWCHNPESQSARPELFFTPEKCTGCGRCVPACPNQCHAIREGRHIFDRSRCAACGKCTGNCFSGALETVGKRMSVEEVMKEVLADRIFYENSGGGLTLSGGEPLFHFAFTQALLEAARREKLHTCLETSGYAPPENLRALLPLVDLWLWDVKTPPENHEKWTGVSSALILENLRMIDALNAKIRLRCPLIPGVNDGEADLIRLAGLADSLRGIQGIDLEPYHPLGESKGARLGRISIFRAGFTDRSKIAEYGTTMKRYTKIPVHCS